MNPFQMFPLFFLGIALVLGCGVIGFCFYLYCKARKKIQSIQSTPTAEIGDLDNGYWKTSGKAVAVDAPILSPMSQTKCVFYLFKVEELKTRSSSQTAHGHGRRSGHSRTTTRTQTYWETVITDRQAVKCGVEDGTAFAKIDMLDAETVFSPSSHSQSGTFDSCPVELQKTLSQRYGFSTKGLLMNKQLRYTETVIVEGDELFVIGDVKKQGAEIEFVRGEEPFIVSDRSEEKLVGHYRLRSTLCIVGMVAATVIFPVAGLMPLLLIKPPQAHAQNTAKPLAAAPGRADGSSTAFGQTGETQGESEPPTKHEHQKKDRAAKNSSPPKSESPAKTNTTPKLEPPVVSTNKTEVVAKADEPARPETTSKPEVPVKKESERPKPTPSTSPPANDTITKAVADLGSTDALTRLRGVAILQKAKPEDSRRDEVVKALKPLMTDKDVNVRTFTLKAIEAWGSKE